MYFDADRLSAMDSYRKCSYCKEYDADGHLAAIICPDSYRNTMNNSDHYAIIKKNYYADGKLRTENFYDQDNTSVQPRNGQYGHLYKRQADL